MNKISLFDLLPCSKYTVILSLFIFSLSASSDLLAKHEYIKFTTPITSLNKLLGFESKDIMSTARNMMIFIRFIKMPLLCKFLGPHVQINMTNTLKHLIMVNLMWLFSTHLH